MTNLRHFHLTSITNLSTVRAYLNILITNELKLSVFYHLTIESYLKDFKRIFDFSYYLFPLTASAFLVCDFKTLVAYASFAMPGKITFSAHCDCSSPASCSQSPQSHGRTDRCWNSFAVSWVCRRA